MGYSLPRIVGGPPPLELARQTSKRTGAVQVDLWTYEVPGEGGRGKDKGIAVFRNGSAVTVQEGRARRERGADELFLSGGLGGEGGGGGRVVGLDRSGGREGRMGGVLGPEVCWEGDWEDRERVGVQGRRYPVGRIGLPAWEEWVIAAGGLWELYQGVRVATC